MPQTTYFGTHAVSSPLTITFKCSVVYATLQ